MTRIIYVR